MVDLAGFTKVHCTKGIEEHQTDISLFTLESIITQISKSQNAQEYIDYHNSKLTELLQSSLSGNALIAVICTVTPVALEETYYTLSLVCHFYNAIYNFTCIRILFLIFRFASHTKKIKTKPQKNEVMFDASLLHYAKQVKLEVCTINCNFILKINPCFYDNCCAILELFH